MSSEDITSIYALNNKAPKYIKQKVTEMKGERTIQQQQLKTLIPTFYNKQNYTESQQGNRSEKYSRPVRTLDLQNMQPNTAVYTFFSSAHRTFSRTYHVPGHKTNLNQFKGTKIMQRMLPNQNGM